MEIFVSPNKKNDEKCLADDDYVVKKVMYIKTKINNAYVISSGKNMGVFKGVGFPEEIAEYFMLAEEYEGYIYGQLTTDYPSHKPFDRSS